MFYFTFFIPFAPVHFSPEYLFIASLFYSSVNRYIVCVLRSDAKTTHDSKANLLASMSVPTRDPKLHLVALVYSETDLIALKSTVG
jgi:hypothetical protein